MRSASYVARRGELFTYFDRTAVEAWRKLTSDAPVSRIRRTVRAGRDAMRETLLSWTPEDLAGARILDAGCGSGALAIELAKRGAEVVAIDISPKLVEIGRERAGEIANGVEGPGRIDFRVGDMLDPALGRFDWVCAMDSLIHYEPDDALAAIDALRARSTGALAFTFAPRTPLLSAMHAVGKLFPKGDRAPAIAPISGDRLRRRIESELGGALGRHHRIESGFYLSEAQEVLT